MAYAAGSNIAGYLPEGDVQYFATFEDAKAYVIHELLFASDHDEDENAAEGYSAAAEDANLWGSLDDGWLVYADIGRSLDLAYWVTQVTDDEWEANDPEGYEWAQGEPATYTGKSADLLRSVTQAEDANVVWSPEKGWHA